MMDPSDDAAFHAETGTTLPHRTAPKSRNAKQVIWGDSSISTRMTRLDSTPTPHSRESLGCAVYHQSRHGVVG